MEIGRQFVVTDGAPTVHHRFVDENRFCDQFAVVEP